MLLRIIELIVFVIRCLLMLLLLTIDFNIQLYRILCVEGHLNNLKSKEVKADILNQFHRQSCSLWFHYGRIKNCTVNGDFMQNINYSYLKSSSCYYCRQDSDIVKGNLPSNLNFYTCFTERVPCTTRYGLLF